MRRRGRDKREGRRWGKVGDKVRGGKRVRREGGKKTGVSRRGGDANH